MKTTVSERQIKTAKQELERKIGKSREEWCKKNPYPSWQAEEEWEKKHISPRRKYDADKKKSVKHLEEKMESVLFDARMGKMTDVELYEAVKSF